MLKKLFSRNSPVIGERCFHLDLKGMPPAPGRLLELPEILKILRFNAILIEWEDMYPWTTYPELRSPTSYSATTVKKFLEKLKSCGLEIIPLVQSIGHLENLLLKKRFSHLREVKESAGELCPMHPGSAQRIMALVNDVLRTHADYTRRFHIGGDEPWNFGSCPKCKAYVREHGQALLYLKHVNPVIDHLNRRGIRAILWDDQMRKWPIRILRTLAGRADLDIWNYNGKDIFAETWLKFTPEYLRRCADAGIQWRGACAFKMTSAGRDLPDVPERLGNAASWIRALRQFPQHGLVATGWSRGDFCATAMSGLEPAWDVIIATAALMWDGRLPKDHDKATFKYMRHGPLAGLVGRHFEKCYKSALELDQWNRQMAGSRLWTLLEHAASVSFEPERMNFYTFKRFHGYTALQQELKRGREIGKMFVATHKGLVPDHWLRLYVAARVRHHERRFEQLVNYPRG